MTKGEWVINETDLAVVLAFTTITFGGEHERISAMIIKSALHENGYTDIEAGNLLLDCIERISTAMAGATFNGGDIKVLMERDRQKAAKDGA